MFLLGQVRESFVCRKWISYPVSHIESSLEILLNTSACGVDMIDMQDYLHPDQWKSWTEVGIQVSGLAPQTFGPWRF